MWDYPWNACQHSGWADCHRIRRENIQLRLVHGLGVRRKPVGNYRGGTSYEGHMRYRRRKPVGNPSETFWNILWVTSAICVSWTHRVLGPCLPTRLVDITILSMECYGYSIRFHGFAFSKNGGLGDCLYTNGCSNKVRLVLQIPRCNAGWTWDTVVFWWMDGKTFTIYQKIKTPCV